MLLTCNAAPLWGLPCASYRCNCRSGHDYVLEGVDEHGNVRTAAAKTYPPAFCAFLVNVIVQAYLARAGSDRPPPFDSWGDIDDWAAAAHVPLDLTFAMDAAENWIDGYAPDFHTTSYRADKL